MKTCHKTHSLIEQRGRTFCPHSTPPNENQRSFCSCLVRKKRFSTMAFFFGTGHLNRNSQYFMTMKIAILTSFILCSVLLRTVTSQECTNDGKCDTHERCPVWKDDGECLRNADYMKRYCPASCASLSTLLKQQAATNAGKCEDAHPRCPAWAKLGGCEDNVQMRRYCAKSCDSCLEGLSDSERDSLCVDNHEKCSHWADKGECTNNPKYMSTNCAKSCNTCKKPKAKRQTKELGPEEIKLLSSGFGEIQRAEGTEATKTLEYIAASIDYMKTEQVTSLPKVFRESCTNKQELCTFWAVIGECEKNPAYMKVNCAPACKTCHLIDMSTRCPKLENVLPALGPGGLNKMFERIVDTAPGNRTLTSSEREELYAKGMTDYTVNVISRPSPEPATDVSASNDKSLPPWVITFDNFVTAEECEEIIRLGYETGYKRSEDVGKRNVDGTAGSVQSKGRTSENAWCSDRNECRSKEVPTRIHNRMAQVMGIPAENSEDLQVLKYEVGQFYNTHHDYIPHQRDRQCGPRILTFFIYLSDVEGGGGTNFPKLDITVMPKRGRALLWPSVLDSDPSVIDNRMKHQALPVEAGTKFAANGWIHLHDYVGPQSRGCN